MEFFFFFFFFPSSCFFFLFLQHVTPALYSIFFTSSSFFLCSCSFSFFSFCSFFCSFFYFYFFFCSTPSSGRSGSGRGGQQHWNLADLEALLCILERRPPKIGEQLLTHRTMSMLFLKVTQVELMLQSGQIWKDFHWPCNWYWGLFSPPALSKSNCSRNL